MKQILVLVCVLSLVFVLLKRRLLAVVKRFWPKPKKGEPPASLGEEMTPTPVPTPPVSPKKEPSPMPLGGLGGEGTVLLTCFEQDQLTLLNALGLPSRPADTAFDTVVRLAADSKVVYLTPPLFEDHVSITHALLGLAAGREIISIPMYTNAEGERLNVPLQEAQSELAEAVCIFGIDIAVVPLGQQRAALIREELQRLKEVLGSRLVLFKLRTQDVESWPAASRTKRYELWSEVFEGLDLCIHEG